MYTIYIRFFCYFIIRAVTMQFYVVFPSINMLIPAYILRNFVLMHNIRSAQRLYLYTEAETGWAYVHCSSLLLHTLANSSNRSSLSVNTWGWLRRWRRIYRERFIGCDFYRTNSGHGVIVIIALGTEGSYTYPFFLNCCLIRQVV